MPLLLLLKQQEPLKAVVVVVAASFDQLVDDGRHGQGLWEEENDCRQSKMPIGEGKGLLLLLLLCLPFF